MPTDGAATLFAVALRVARLAADGSTPAGAANMYVTNGLVKVTFTPVYESGDEATKKDGRGNLCLSVKTPDVFKRVDINSVEICSFDPELSELLGGGAIITDGGSPAESIGYAAGRTRCPTASAWRCGRSATSWTHRPRCPTPITCSRGSS
jgi:hypothetical protein